MTEDIIRKRVKERSQGRRTRSLKPERPPTPGRDLEKVFAAARALRKKNRPRDPRPPPTPQVGRLVFHLKKISPYHWEDTIQQEEAQWEEVRVFLKGLELPRLLSPIPPSPPPTQLMRGPLRSRPASPSVSRLPVKSTPPTFQRDTPTVAPSSSPATPPRSTAGPRSDPESGVQGARGGTVYIEVKGTRQK